MDDRTDEQLRTIFGDALHPGRIHATDLPSIDLYMDQIITLMEERYAPNKRTPGEKLLTRTMINNYSKEGLIKPIRGKKYTREHVLEMLAIYELKNTLAIGEIKQVLQTLYAREDFNGERLAACYEQALTRGEQQSAQALSLMECAVAPTEDALWDDETRFTALLTLASLSQAFQVAAERMVDAYFPSRSPKR